MYSFGNFNVVKNANSKDRARFLPSVFMPFRIFFMIGGNSEKLISKFFSGIRCWVYGDVGFLIGVFSFFQSNAWINKSLASFSSGFDINGFIFVIFSGSASVGLNLSIWFFVIGIDARAVFSWREYGARNKCLEDTRTMSTASWVDFIVSSVLNSVLFFLTSPPKELDASSFAVFILQFSQKFIFLWEILCILPLQDGHIISFRFDFIDSTSVLHFMSGHLYFPIFFVSVLFPHIGQSFSDVSSPVRFSFSLPVKFKIS